MSHLLSRIGKLQTGELSEPISKHSSEDSTGQFLITPPTIKTLQPSTLEAEIKAREEAEQHVLLASTIDKNLEHIYGKCTDSAELLEKFKEKSPEVYSHCQRVAFFTLDFLILNRDNIDLFGHSLNDDEINATVFAAAIHDISKTEPITEEVVNFPGRLESPQQKAVQKYHPIASGNLAYLLGYPPEVYENVALHHKDLSGGGFPNEGEFQHIPLVVQVFGLFDKLDAVISQVGRPYKAAIYAELGKTPPTPPEVIKEFIGDTRLQLHATPILLKYFDDYLAAESGIYEFLSDPDLPKSQLEYIYRGYMDNLGMKNNIDSVAERAEELKLKHEIETQQAPLITQSNVLPFRRYNPKDESAA